MTAGLRVPCAYQGGKQRIAKQIVEKLLLASDSEDTIFYDLCCGSGAISIELVNRGVTPNRIIMLDCSSWGRFWTAVGAGDFDTRYFDLLLADLPENKRGIKEYMTRLSLAPVNEHEAEIYPILQACSFGGKQIWRNAGKWENAFFRDYWEPTATSVRRSPANPMQPSPKELRRRICNLIEGMHGVRCLATDIMQLLNCNVPSNSVVYIDPPYSGTTGYAFGFDVCQFVNQLRLKTEAPIFVSEGMPLNNNAMQLHFGGAKGGISGTRIGKHQEWISRF
ncbi:hypothetical protein [Bifidobacterium moukalabense]|uniref:hypothetical protein n=1 Tax=Bifidobacterium moukalabense TaxID=1333651 RepID=UPI0010F93EB0|nr:hypothetical protein [Bifidobacterium moukalabense]